GIGKESSYRMHFGRGDVPRRADASRSALFFPLANVALERVDLGRERKLVDLGDDIHLAEPREQDPHVEQRGLTVLAEPAPVARGILVPTVVGSLEFFVELLEPGRAPHDLVELRRAGIRAGRGNRGGAAVLLKAMNDPLRQVLIDARSGC